MKKGLLLIVCLLAISNQTNAQHWLDSKRIYLDKWFGDFPKNIEGFKTMLSEEWTANTWVGSLRFTHRGGTSTEPANILREYSDGSQWGKDSSSYTFENGRIKQISTLLAPDGSREIFVYDLNGRLGKRLYQNATNMSWENAQLDSNIYNAAGKVILTYKQNWVANKWENNRLDTLIYNASGKLILTEARVWFWDSYWPANRYHYNYDANNNMTGIRLESLSSTLTGTQVKVDTTGRRTLTYDAQGRMTQIVSQNYDNITRTWSNSYRIRFTLTTT